MLKDCLDIFKNEYEEKGDALITDNYVLGEGSYILVNEDGSIEQPLEVTKKNFERANCEDFIVIDYLSRLLEMNKPIDGKKVIHSNNYLAFWVKKDSLKPDDKGKVKLTNEIIENYYKTLSNPKIEKYSGSNKKESLKLYEQVEEQIGEPNIELINKNKQWIKENIFTIIDKHNLKNDKNYLKIFFKAPMDEYKKENERYIIPNIYNSTDYNVVMKDSTYGLPNDNMGLNAKKPYLENKSRKNSIPYLVSTNEVNLQKKFIDYIYNEACNGKTNIYIGDKGFMPYKNDEDLEENFTGYFLRIKKGKEVEIHDFDIVTGFRPQIRPLNIRQVIPVNSEKANNNKEEIVYGELNKLKDVKNRVNATFFKKFLTTNYFTEPKDIKLTDFVVKEELLKCRNGFFTWFYKGNNNIIKTIFPKSSLELIKNSICNEYYQKAIDQFNVRSSIVMYFKGGENMADKLKAIHDILREKINSSDTIAITSDDEYYFAVGQLANYLLSLNRSNKKMHSMINPIINCKNNDKLREEIRKLFKKYNYTINKPSKRYENIHAMILSYNPESNVNDEILLAGYLYSSLIYEKGDEK